ncbi:MAG TPA: hypothetical protein VJI46_00110 [Candidatus Nanoarchaeia archaeon]|nr:hypothetical protein [Candidatus Nanoarchaeia archaeon]
MIFFHSGEYRKFKSTLNRMKKFERIAERELYTENYKELFRHIKNLRLIYPMLIENYKRETGKMSNLPQVGQLNETIAKVDNGLRTIKSYLDSASSIVEEILRNQDQSKKDKLLLNLRGLIPLLEKAERDFKELDHEEITLSKLPPIIKPITKIPIAGALRNGWKLSDIQNVIVELGGRVEKTGGRHPYAIKIGKAQMPLAESTPWDNLVVLVARETKIPSGLLRKSFSSGRLIV